MPAARHKPVSFSSNTKPYYVFPRDTS
jgi:hypothetical protein